MDIIEEGKVKLEGLFKKAGVEIRSHEVGLMHPSVRNGFGGVLLPEGGCLVWSRRDFEWSTLTHLSAAITQPDETIVIFTETVMTCLSDRASRQVINGVAPAIVTRGMTLHNAVCVIKRGAIVFIEYSPHTERGVLTLPRTCAENLIYGADR